MATEIITGIGLFKTMLDMAKGLKDINDAAVRNGAVIELQEQILAAQDAQSSLIERVRSLEAEVAAFETWDAESQRYALEEVATGVFIYARKPDAQPLEPAHKICPNCYADRRKSVLQREHIAHGRIEALVCKRCGSHFFVHGGPETLGTPNVHRGSTWNRDRR